MLPIAGRPLLDYHLEWLRRYGITEVYITVNHLKESILAHCGDGSRFGMRIGYYEEPEPLGTVGGVKALEAQLDEDFIVVYGDVMADMHLGMLMDAHRGNNSIATLVLHPNDHPYDSDLVELDHQQRITAFHAKPHAEGNYYRNLVNAGVYVFSPEIFTHLETGRKADFGHDIFPRLVQQAKVNGYITSEYLKDMGTPGRLEKVTADLLSGKIRRASYDMPQKAIFLDRDGVLNDDTEFIHTPEDFHLYDFTARAVKKINASDYLALVATNQSVVARNLCTEDELRIIHNKLETDLGRERAWLDAIYYCPHHPNKGYPDENPAYKIDCGCRKPKPGMLLQGARDFHVDLGQSYMVGDNERDIQAGKSAGCITVGVATGKGLTGTTLLPDYFFTDLEEAVDFIVDDPLRKTAEHLFSKIDFEKKPFIITLGGNTQSGKSTLATYLQKFLETKGKSVLKIELDSWILAPDKRPKNSNVFRNFQSEKIAADLGRIFRGGEIEAEGYARHPERKPIPQKYRYAGEAVVIIEGVIALSLPELRELADLKIYKDISETDLEQRMKKYYRWKGLSPEAIQALWEQRLEQEYRLIEKDSKWADMTV